MAGNLGKYTNFIPITAAPELRRVKNTIVQNFTAPLTVIGMTNATAPGTVAAAVNLLHTAPLYSQGGMIYSISFEVTGGGAAGSVARVGLYSNTEEPNMFYPDKLLFDSGEISTTGTGIKTTVCNVNVPPGLSCWGVYHAGVAAPTIRTVPVAATYLETISQANLSTQYTCISTSKVYDILPNKYPYPITFGSNTVFPLIAISWNK